MSSGSAAVKLEDGTLKYTIYNGTSDILVPRLYDTTQEAWDKRRTDLPYVSCPCEPRPVEIWTVYGGGFGWKAEGCEHRVHNHLAPDGLEIGYTHWMPGEEPVEMFFEQPDWVVF